MLETAAVEVQSWKNGLGNNLAFLSFIAKENAAALGACF
jgi:hypothetical protein